MYEKEFEAAGHRRAGSNRCLRGSRGVPSYAINVDTILPSKGELEKWNTSATNNAWIYGVAGGNVFTDLVDDGTIGGLVNSYLGEGKIQSSSAADSTSAGITLGYLNNGSSKPDTNTRYYGAFGGDVVIGTGFGKASEGVISVEKAINDNIANHLNGGAVLGGVGGSAAIGIGGINSSRTSGVDLTTTFSSLLNGEAHATVNGDITTTIEKDAKVVGFFNGGLAAGIGTGTQVDEGNKTVSNIQPTPTTDTATTTTSTVNGSTSLIINGGEMNPSDYHGDTDTVTKVLDAMWQNKINAVGVVGGGGRHRRRPCGSGAYVCSKNRR